MTFCRPLWILRHFKSGKCKKLYFKLWCDGGTPTQSDVVEENLSKVVLEVLNLSMTVFSRIL